MGGNSDSDSDLYRSDLDLGGRSDEKSEFRFWRDESFD